MLLFKKITLFICAAIIAWAAGLGLYVGNIILSSPYKPKMKTDAIVVFTGHRDRIKEGITLFSAGAAPVFLISGVHPNVTREEVLEKFQGHNTLPDCCLTFGYEATTTVENALETRRWVKDKDIKTLRLVTSDYHMNRALIELKHQVPDITIIPHTVKHSARTLDTRQFWVIAFEEYHKAVFRWLQLMFQTPSPVYDEKDHH